MFRNVHTVHVDEDAGVLSDLFATHHVALIVNDAERLVGLLSKMDLVDHLTRSTSVARAT